MSQRSSGYARQERDLYETPEWVTFALVPHIKYRVNSIWEPAAASGKIVRALESSGFAVEASDLHAPIATDFLKCESARCDAIVTNPPFGLAEEFIERSLALTEPSRGLVAMLLRTDYDHAKTRQYLFSGCRAFAKKLVLTRRIVWFERPGAAPSYNHAWFVWDWQNIGAPTIAYGPQPDPVTGPVPRPEFERATKASHGEAGKIINDYVPGWKTAEAV